MNCEKIRKNFPQLKQGFIYFDSGSTSLKPRPVIEAVTDYYNTLSVNVGRGIHRPSSLATKAYKSAHEKLRHFLNGQGYIIFTKNCTEAINIVSHGLDWKPGDKIVTTYLEHNSNLLPWLDLRPLGVEVSLIKCGDDGSLNLKDFEEAIGEKTKLVAVTHASNVLGYIVPVEEITKIAKKKGVMVLIDGAQAAPHIKVDLDSIGCDFYAGSGHKMCGPSGTGFLYIKEDAFDHLKPTMLGGGSATEVEFDKITFTEGPSIFEAGTPNIAGGIGLGAAVDFLQNIGMSEIRKHELALLEYLLDKLMTIKDIIIYGPGDLKQRTGVVSFMIGDIPAHRIAIILDELGGIAIRSGHHCAFLLTHKILKQVCGTARVSFYLYNTFEEIDHFVETLHEVIKYV